MPSKVGAKPSIAVVLSGCGHRDGSEIHEATLTLLAIHRHGADYQCYAPDRGQLAVISHLTSENMAERRNVLVEAARIARGQIKPLAAFNALAHDALIFPGGVGAAMNLCDYAEKGGDCQPLPEVAQAIAAMRTAGKPIGALCIAPVVLAAAIGGVTLTIGNDDKVAADLRAMGAHHEKTGPDGVVIDKKFRVVTTPCYMFDSIRLDTLAASIDRLVAAVLELAKESVL
ncbi:MAG: isoprenoid biosynthesis glyoxalase ElbB [Desulfobulbaceae bacterium]|jgi:enhancing lycopene biosynthesis protein 2|nr:isoprenoid biosynthesis glyoxalase ElbB [Desulfobulbaceae bacterium]